MTNKKHHTEVCCLFNTTSFNWSYIWDTRCLVSHTWTRGVHGCFYIFICMYIRYNIERHHWIGPCVCMCVWQNGMCCPQCTSMRVLGMCVTLSSNYWHYAHTQANTSAFSSCPAWTVQGPDADSGQSETRLWCGHESSPQVRFPDLSNNLTGFL